MSYVDFIVLATKAEDKGHLVFDDKFALLRSAKGNPDVLGLWTADIRIAFDYFVVNGLQFCNLQLAYITNVEIEALVFEVCYILLGEND